MSSAPSIVVVSVAYQSFGEVPAMAASLPPSVTLCLVDNGPDDGLRDWAKEHGIACLVPDQNVGYGAGCNMGAAAFPDADFYLFLNPDARLEPETIARLINAAKRYPTAAAMCPMVLRASGAQWPLRVSLFAPHTIQSQWDLYPKEDTEAPSLIGPALFVRGAAFRRVDGFDPEFLMYFEDDDLTMRLAEEVGPLWFVASAKVFHKGGQSTTPSMRLIGFKGYHFGRSQVLLARKRGLRLPFWKPFLTALHSCASRKMLHNPYYRRWTLGRVAGALSCLQSEGRMRRNP